MNEQVLSDDQIETAVEELNVAWSAIPGQGLVRVFETSNFAEGLALVNEIAKVAEAQNHHPDVTLRYNEVELTTTTHSASGVTQKDIDLAKSIDKLTT